MRNCWIGGGAVMLLLASEAAGQGSLHGTVRDQAGQAVAGARVHASDRAATTDAGGAYMLAGLSPGEHRVQAAALGFAAAEATVRVQEGRTSLAHLVLARTPLELPAVRVVGSPASGQPAGVAQATARLAGRALDREVGGTLAETLRAQPGVAVRSMGPAASMPVLRGLTGDRILVLHDGQRAGDLAGSADDHGVTLDPLAAGRVEVVRGPAALLYGPNALGGVVNLVSDDLPRHRPARAEWSLAGQSGSAHPGGGASVRGAVPLYGGWTAAARFGARRAGELRLPAGERLDNTAAASWSAALGAGHIGERTHGGAVLRGYGFGYGLPTPPGAGAVRLEGRRVEAQARLQAAGVRLQAAAQTYGHDEIDAGDGALLQRFALRTGTAALHARQGEHGAWGATLLVKDYHAEGPAALTPPALSSGVGVFGYRELPLDRWTLQLGARWDGYRTHSESTPKFGPGRTRRFGAVSGSAGARWEPVSGMALSGSVARAFRAPSVEELFSGAAHAGTGAVEIGDPGLDAERATSAEVGVHGEGARWALALSAYRTRIDGYVHLAARGDTVVEGAVLPVLAHAQTAAQVQGLEASLELVAARELVLALSADALRGIGGAGRPLSYMPAPSLTAALRREGVRWSYGADVRRVFRQDRVGAADEHPTAAYTLARLHAGVRFAYGGSAHTLSLRVDNLADADHREATSRIKDFAPGPGRGVSLLYRVVH